MKALNLSQLLVYSWYVFFTKYHHHANCISVICMIYHMCIFSSWLIDTLPFNKLVNLLYSNKNWCIHSVMICMHWNPIIDNQIAHRNVFQFEKKEKAKSFNLFRIINNRKGDKPKEFIFPFVFKLHHWPFIKKIYQIRMARGFRSTIFDTI